jgi:hypothetical protein
MEEEEGEENDESTDGAKQRVVRSGLPDLSIATPRKGRTNACRFTGLDSQA